MPDQSIPLESGHIHLSPIASRIAAQDYFKCFLDFEKPRRFSPVPFFLCCRAIELALKAIHLETKTVKIMKDIYKHNLMRLYRELPDCDLKLSPEEAALLEAANALYTKKDFEYLNSPYDAATGFSRFPDLEALAQLTRKVTGYSE